MGLGVSRADWHRFRAATPEQRAIWRRAFAAVTAARIGVAFVPVERLASRFGIAVCRGEAQPRFSEATSAVMTAAGIRAVLRRWPSRSPCLIGALAAGLLLRRSNPTLFIGVRRLADGVTAHAWLDVADGRVPLMLPDDSFDFVRLRRSGEV